MVEDILVNQKLVHCQAEFIIWRKEPESPAPQGAQRRRRNWVFDGFWIHFTVQLLHVASIFWDLIIFKPNGMVRGGEVDHADANSTNLAGHRHEGCPAPTQWRRILITGWYAFRIPAGTWDSRQANVVETC